MSSGFFSGDKDYCENTRSVSNMLETFDNDRKKVLTLLKNDPNKLISLLWSNNSPICKDDECLFQMGKSLTLSIEDLLEQKANTCDSLINFYICPQCKNMKRIIDFYKIKAKDPFVIECGDKAGTYLSYDKFDISNLYLILDKKLPHSVKKVLNHPNILDLAKCSSATCPVASLKNGKDLIEKYSKMNYLGSDSFTNSFLINWYLNDELYNTFYGKVSNIVHNNISFICNDKGYTLHEYTDIGIISLFQDFPEYLDNMDNKNGKPSPTSKADDKSPLDKTLVKGIIMQLFAILSYLRKYDFSHGNPSTNSLKFKIEPVSYIIDGVHVKCPVALKLDDFSNSGCTILNNYTRLYSKSIVGDEELKKKTYDPIVETNHYENGKVTVYRLKDPVKYIKSNILFLYMKHLGLPVYSSSFDAYSFMIVLMCERSFYISVINDLVLNAFWKSMWVSDFDIISDRIRNYHEKSSISPIDVYSILSNINLRCDMIDFGWNLIRTF